MAIDINEFKLPISPREARDYVQSQTDNFGVFFDMDRCFELTAIFQSDMLDISRKCKRLANMPSLSLRDKQDVISVLRKMGVSASEFLAGNKNAYSFTEGIRQNILNNVKYSDDVREFINLYSTYATLRRNKGTIENFATKSPTSRALSKKDHRMAVANPKWSILNTSRIAASDPGIQGIPRSCGDIICEPKGYTLVRCDSGQIEPRINFSAYVKDELIMNLIMYYNDAYYGIMHYCIMSDDLYKPLREDFKKYFKPIEITDEIKDMRQNIKRLTNAGSYGSTHLDGINPTLAKAYERKIVKHPARLALEARVKDEVSRGINTFYGFFGTPVTPGETEKYSVNDDGWREHVIRCGINNPIQTTASELMMFSINRAREIISRAKDTHICFYKHDEACFYVSDEDMANGIGDELSDVTAYNVKGWVPIEADALIGIKPGDYPSYIL